MFKIKNKLLIYLALSVFLIFSVSFLIIPLKAVSFNILKAPLSLVTFIRREITGIIFYHRNFVENEKLKQHVNRMKYKINSLNEAALENERLSSLLLLKQQSSYKVIASRVIGRSADNWSSLIIIDKGSSDGVNRGLAVSGYLGLAGRVTEVTKNTSKVLLINDPGMAVSAVAQRSRQEGLVSGSLGNYLIMKYLPKDADILPSDLVLTSGLTGIYPKGLLIGTVVSVGEEFSGLSRYAIIKPAVNPGNIEEVLVIVQ